MRKIRTEGPRAQGPVTGIVLVSFLILSLFCFSNVGLVQNAQGLDPHIITGTVYEANGTTCNNCNVTVTNARTGESSSGVTSNATGIYAFNLLNLPSGWAYGDTIQVEAENSTGTNGTNSTQITIGTVSTGIDVWIGTSQAVSGVNFYVIDEDGKEVSGAYINIKDSDDDIVTTKITDSDGKASYTLSDGIYTLTTSKAGYDDVTDTIRVHGSSTFTIILAEVEEGVTLSNIWYWALLLLAVVGIIAVLLYITKKVI